MSRFADIDLSKIAPPPIIETLDYEVIRQALLDDAVARLNAAGIPYDTESLETDPVVILCEAFAYRELGIRARFNDGLKAVLLATSYAGNLDHLGALYATERQPAVDEPRPYATNPEDWETDARYRRRIQLAPEALSTCGPEGAYQYHVLTFAPWARDVSAKKVAPGRVRVSVLKEGVTPAPTQADLLPIAAYLSGPDKTPLTDVVLVEPVVVRHVAIKAKLTLYPGPDATVVKASVLAALNSWLETNRMLGMNLRRSALYAKLHHEGVHSVELTSPAADIVLDPHEVYAITATDITIASLRDE